MKKVQHPFAAFACWLTCGAALLSLSTMVHADAPGPGRVVSISRQPESSRPPIDPEYDRLSAQIQDAIRRAKPACVAVGRRLGERTQGGFSAVIVSPEGHVLTAGHCIRPDTDYEVLLTDGRILKARSLGRSAHLDCGLLKIVDETEFPWAELGTSSDLVRNQPCLSISHPGGVDAQRGPVIRFGRVLGKNSRGHIHNTCLMEPGDSGGGLFDLEGRVIGIHSYIHQSLSDNFDIPVDLFRDHWESLCQAAEFDPSYAVPRFGIQLQSNRATEDGSEVTSVVEDSPAAEAGLQVGDVIQRVNDTEVVEGFRTGRVLQRIMFRRGRPLKLIVRRDEETHTIEIQTPVPEVSPVRDTPGGELDRVAHLALGLARLEESLDDYTVRVKSRRDGQELSLLGTVLSRDGLILSKSSRVGESPSVIDEREQTLPARVVARDDDSDLVLLRVDSPFEHALDFTAMSEPVEGASC